MQIQIQIQIQTKACVVKKRVVFQGNLLFANQGEGDTREKEVRVEPVAPLEKKREPPTAEPMHIPWKLPGPFIFRETARNPSENLSSRIVTLDPLSRLHSPLIPSLCNANTLKRDKLRSLENANVKEENFSGDLNVPPRSRDI